MSIIDFGQNEYQLIYCNLFFRQTNLRTSLSYGAKLLAEVNFVTSKIGRLENASIEFHSDFMKLEILLESLTQKASEHLSSTFANNNPTLSTQRNTETHLASLINAVIGAIELNLLSYLPLIDPVEKNRLKKLYTGEDATRFSQLITAFECMRITMSYRGLATETIGHFRTKLEALNQRQEKLAKKVALRPEQSLYGHLVRDINHFLRTCCHPRTLVELFEAVEEVLQPEASEFSAQEVIKRIDLWIANASQFRHHTLAQYVGYYRDFLAPLENSVTMLRHGFVGLRHCLVRRLEAPRLRNSEEDIVAGVLENLVEFPSVRGLTVLPYGSNAQAAANVKQVLGRLEHVDATFFV